MYKVLIAMLALSAGPALSQSYVVRFASSKVIIGQDEFRKSDALKVKVGGLGLARPPAWWFGEVRFDQQANIENVKTVDISLIRLNEGTATQLGLSASSTQANVVDLSLAGNISRMGDKSIGIAVIAVDSPDQLYDYIVSDYLKAVNSAWIQRKMRYEDPRFRFVTEVIKAVAWNEVFESAAGGKIKGEISAADNLSVESSGSRAISGNVNLSTGTTIGYNFSMLCWRDGMPNGFEIDRIDVGRDEENCPARPRTRGSY